MTASKQSSCRTSRPLKCTGGYRPPITTLLVLAAIAAVADWVAVERSLTKLEYVAKPVTTLLLLGAAVAGSADGWTLAALALCLAGDAFLMLPRDLFVPGLVAFLLGHVGFVVAFFGLPHARVSFWLTTQIVLALVVLPVIARPIVAGARRTDAALVWPVRVYALVIGTMFAFSGITRSWAAVAGAAVFVLSDSVLARNRFVRPIAHGRLAVMVTYHAALALLVVALA